MSEARYPADISVNAGDFQSSGWKEVASALDKPGYTFLWSALSKAAKESVTAGDMERGKVLWLLADVCSMMLKPESYNDPFHPLMVMAGQRSALAEDFSADDLDFFEQVLSDIDDPWIHARIADVLWLRRTPKESSHALAAIDAYVRIPLDKESWFSDGGECWKRAVSLVKLLRSGAGNRLEQISTALLDACKAAGASDGFYAHQIASVLLEQRLLLEGDLVPLAEHLESIAAEFKGNNQHRQCRAYYDITSRLYQGAGDVEKYADLVIEQAESWVAEATTAGSSFVSTGFIENAIQFYRGLPRKTREERGLHSRMNELRRMLGDASERSMGEFKTLETDPIDITEMVVWARDIVRGKEPADALRTFACLSECTAEKVRDAATAAIRQNPISHLFPITSFSSDGRVIAKTPGMDVQETIIGGHPAAVWRQMVQHHGIMVDLAVKGKILPAFEVLLQEHRLTLHDFKGLTRESPIVPPDRVDIFAAALHEGYEWKFAAAIHLLAPQIENMVRYHLKAAGAETATLNQQGIETENGLSTLVELPEMVPVFGNDLTFEIRALFCDPLGPNLRNQVAHGLLSHVGSYSPAAVYAWWLSLKLVFRAYWNAHRSEAADPEPESST